MKTIKKLAGSAIVAAFLATPALAIDFNSVTFAQYTQQTSNKVVQYGATASGNTLSIVRAPVYFVINAFGPLSFTPTILSMSGSSTAAVTSNGPQFQQLGWNGSMNFGDGTNYLTVNFANATFSFDSAGGSASLISTDPNHPISYTSNVLTLPAFTFKNFSLAFTAITPPFMVGSNGYGSPFSANTAGSFAGSTDIGGEGAIPEPASWAMMLLGFGAVGTMARRRSGMATVAA